MQMSLIFDYFFKHAVVELIYIFPDTVKAIRRGDSSEAYKDPLPSLFIVYDRRLQPTNVTFTVNAIKFLISEFKKIELTLLLNLKCPCMW